MVVQSLLIKYKLQPINLIAKQLYSSSILFIDKLSKESISNEQVPMLCFFAQNSM